MAAIAFDPLEFAQQLEASGMPRAQAEAVAKGLTSMFVHNFDALVTKDYLDTRFAEFESRIELKMEKRFAEMDLRIDERFDKVEERFREIDERFNDVDRRFAAIDVKFARVNVMLGIILIAVAVPLLQFFLGWLG